MKPKSKSSFACQSLGHAVVLTCGFIALAASAHAANYYLDTNGDTAGSGIVEGSSISGDKAETNWTTNTSGTATTAVRADRNPIIFSAGSDAAGLNYTITGGLSQPSLISVEEGNVTINATMQAFSTPTVRTASGAALNITGAWDFYGKVLPFDTLGTSTITLNSISTTSGRGGGVNKTGPGLLVVTGAASARTLTVNVNNGEMRIQNGNAMYTAAYAPPNYTYTATVNSGGTLELDNNITVASNPITINGYGFNNGVIDLGALANHAGNNSYNSLITLGSASRINNNASGTTLTLNPAAGSAIVGAYGLTTGGAGHITVGKPIDAVASLTKDGPGTLTLGGANTYNGATTVMGGSLIAGGIHAFSDSAAAVTVNAATVVDLAGQTLTAGKTYVLAGGSLTNSTGTATLNTSAAATLDTGGTYAPGTTPTVTLGGPGSGAAITPLLKLANSTVSNLVGGSGYSSTASAAFTAAPAGGARATATLSFGLTHASITSVTGGTGWAIGDTVSINGGTTAALATVSNVSAGAITELTLTTSGSGYTAAPTAVTKVTSATGNATGVAITGNATNFTVAAVNIASLGSGYTTAPELTISAPNTGGTQATVTAPNSTVYGFTFSNGGSGYSSAPTVTLSGGIVDATAIGGFASIQLTADSSMGGAGDMVVHPAISSTGAFGLTKIGAGSLSLTATNSYGGNTVVSEGTLSLGNGTNNTSLAYTADVVVASGAILNLNYTGTDTIDQLTLAGVQLAPGIYGSSHASNRITGAGTLTVLNGPSASSAYDTWAITTHGLSGGNAEFDFDFENDGLANGLEWILGGNPKSGTPTVSPLASRDPSGNLVLQFTREEDSITESTLTLQYDTNLDGIWANSFVIDADGGTDANGVIVLIDQVPDPDNVTVTIPAAAAPGGKAFARLKATKP